MDPTTTVATQRQFPCKKCGGNLTFAPGTYSLKCPYCGAQNEIPAPAERVEEQDFTAFFRDCCNEGDMREVLAVKCNTCGAETTLAPNVTSGRCPFCGSPIVAEGASKKLIRPKSLLPFHVTKEQAAESFGQWISNRWFAPGELRRRAQTAEITGVYIPCWTYDADTTSRYSGERGDDYWDTETYTETDSEGRTVTRTRQVLKTRWWPVSGSVDESFDDVLVLASQSLPRKYAEALEPWDLENLVVYRDEYLSGFVAESYQINLPQGFETARQIMDPEIRQTICGDIGGDHQRIYSVDTQYFNVTFKHLLLPVWISAYLYAMKTYHFLVNARTGEVQGERPYSWMKIVLLVAAMLAAIGAVALIVSLQQRG